MSQATDRLRAFGDDVGRIVESYSDIPSEDRAFFLMTQIMDLGHSLERERAGSDADGMTMLQFHRFLRLLERQLLVIAFSADSQELKETDQS